MSTQSVFLILWTTNNTSLVDISAASQNDPNSAWEAKVTDFFKDQLKTKDAHTWVFYLSFVNIYVIACVWAHTLLLDKHVHIGAGSIYERRPSALPEA